MHYIRQSLCLTVEELVGTSTLCWNCVVIEVFLDIFLDDNCMLLDLFQSLWICEPCTLSSICQFTRKKIFSEFLASGTPHLSWLWYVGWFAELQARWFSAPWKSYTGQIWDLFPSPNRIHVLGCSYWDLPMGTDSCIQCTGNILELAVKNTEQSSPSREENRWLGTWQ